MDSNDGNAFGAGMLVIIVSGLLIVLGGIFGSTLGRYYGQKETAILTVNGLNRIKEQLPTGTKITNPFGDEDLKSLSYDAQKILRLFN
jgi:hypothetical protein